MPGRLWRAANPHLPEAERGRFVSALTDAPRAVKTARAEKDADAVGRRSVDTAKYSLGERGPVWWTDGAPDQNRKMAKNSSYAGWYAVQCDR